SSGPRSRIVLAGLTGAAAAWAGTRAGASWRAGAAGRIGSDWPGAVAEDLACLALARTAVHTR
ncbi:MAG TPA: hypothetical protein VHO01_13000, partial [Jatrophihabitans sp.]|nr:hypothetical protein [Jatrophihabitans sp.]